MTMPIKYMANTHKIILKATVISYTDRLSDEKLTIEKN